MRLMKRNTYAALAIAAVATFGLAACAPAAEEPVTEPAPAVTEEMEDFTANLVGAGCAAYAEQVPDGGGSIDGMAVDPVATAASNIVGEQTTVQGGAVTVAGSGDNLTVNDATVICGGVVTSNAIVYLIDTVLSPPAA